MMAGLTCPRPKKRVYQSEEAPFPVPIETITKKQAADGHWFFYTGHLATNCVLVKREGDIIFLYKMGFFGKGILSKSKPQHHKFASSFQGLRRKNLPAKERKFQQQRFQQVRHHKYERHLSWQQLLAQQNQKKQSEESQIQTCLSSASRDASSSGIDDNQEGSSSSSGCQGSASVKEEPSTRTDVQHNLQCDIPSTSGYVMQQSKGPSIEDPIMDSEDPKADVTNTVMTSDDSNETGRTKQQREWMVEGYEVSDLTIPAGQVPNDNVTGASTSHVCDDNTVYSEESGEELIIVSDNEVDNNRDDKASEGSTDASKKGTKKVIKKSEPFKIYEYLQLSFEEAFFLSFGLGCLSVLDEDGKPMMLSRMWRTFCSRQSNFLPNYVVYHYLRSKGWVPKGGAKYGADFVLYKKGPPFYHASYSVVVNMIDEHSSTQHADKRFWNWNAVTGLNRITENVAKEVLVCYVLKPPGMQQVDLASPRCLRRFKVQEVVMKRWVSSQERESSNTVPLIS